MGHVSSDASLSDGCKCALLKECDVACKNLFSSYFQTFPAVIKYSYCSPFYNPVSLQFHQEAVCICMTSPSPFFFFFSLTTSLFLCPDK